MHWVCDEVVEVILLRHRRTVNELLTANIPRMFDRIAHDMIEQDIDSCFLVTEIGQVLFKSPRVEMNFEEGDLFVTRPIAPMPVPVVPRLHTSFDATVNLPFCALLNNIKTCPKATAPTAPTATAAVTSGEAGVVEVECFRAWKMYVSFELGASVFTLSLTPWSCIIAFRSQGWELLV
ncbi:unnamed protein product [Symbiodinium sp. CCMP2592]|nr:unnamed protein product [Symbiodinium sp. CCMP2592]